MDLTKFTLDMDLEKWRMVPIEMVSVDVVRLIQEAVPVEDLLNAAKDGFVRGPDPFPHLVSIRHDLWAEEGEQSILVWRIRGCGLMPMRVLRVA